MIGRTKAPPYYTGVGIFWIQSSYTVKFIYLSKNDVSIFWSCIDFFFFALKLEFKLFEDVCKTVLRKISAIKSRTTFRRRHYYSVCCSYRETSLSFDSCNKCFDEAINEFALSFKTRGE